jgi:hypothetical protein
MTMSYGFSANVSQKGAMTFQGLVATAFVLCCFSGFLTVDQISRERREGTLGLLFLTRVRVMDVLVGNFGAAGIASLCALTAFVPVLIVPILSGGVTGGEAVRKVLALFDTMFLSLAIGLWASAGAREWRSSVRAAALILLICIVGPLPAHLPGPLRAIQAADDVSYNASAGAFWNSIIFVQVESWALMLWAIIRLRLAVRDNDETVAGAVRPAASEDEAPIFELAWHQFKRRKYKPLTDNVAPMDWLLRRQKGSASVVWAGTLLWLFYILGARFPLTPTSRTIYSYQSLYLTIAVLQACMFAWVASRFFIDARRTGALELLLTTPEGARTIVVNQWNWLRRMFYWPVILQVTLWVVFQMTSFIQMKSNGVFRVYQPWYITLEIFQDANVVAGVVALLWAGMWFGWSQRTHARAIVWVIVMTKGLPYVAGVILNWVINRNTLSVINSRNAGYSILTWNILPIMTLLYYLWLIRWAKRRFGAVLLSTRTESTPKTAWQLFYRADT